MLFTEIKKWLSLKMFIIILGIIIVGFLLATVRFRNLLLLGENTDVFLSMCAIFDDFSVILQLILFYFFSKVYAGENEYKMNNLVLTTKSYVRYYDLVKVELALLISVALWVVYIALVMLGMDVLYSNLNNYEMVGDFAVSINNLSGITSIKHVLIYKVIATLFTFITESIICMVVSKTVGKSVACFIMVTVFSFVCAAIPSKIPVISEILNTFPFVLGCRTSVYRTIIEIGSVNIHLLDVMFLIYAVCSCLIVQKLRGFKMKG